MSVVCEKVKKKVCELMVKVLSFQYFYRHWARSYWISHLTCDLVDHAVIKLFHRSNAIPTATYDEERSLYHGV